MGKVVQIRKVTSPKSEDFGKWILTVGDAGYLGMIENTEVIFKADTRKAVKAYAEQNNIIVNYIESGRSPSGCKW